MHTNEHAMSIHTQRRRTCAGAGAEAGAEVFSPKGSKSSSAPDDLAGVDEVLRGLKSSSSSLLSPYDLPPELNLIWILPSSSEICQQAMSGS